ncbi:MAG: 5'-nucleotidase, lipoprotein e(P4) family [Bdellovibrionales bacterium]|jgi:5'-nucleotidase (lipoprotein e(P4) family)|nr:5'-nucleotidase, lipoprotein e(P4) family [Bdellovibrionales bacterium]
MNQLTIFLMFVLVSCASNTKNAQKTNQDHLIASTLWFQSAAEVKALSYQAFNIAKMQLDLDLRKKSNKKRAVVVDVDETIVDNSPYQARNILENKTYNSDSWGKWVSKAKATAIPGSIEFLQYANNKGVEVFYITNRKVRGFDATYKNLVDLGFPVKKENMFLRNKDRSKKVRRSKVLKDHKIVLLMGDNLGDFSEVFEGISTSDRDKAVENSRFEFGKRFIVLPNPMYGDWEGALYDYDFKKSLVEKEKIRKSLLKQ